MTPVSSKLYADDVSLLMVLIDTNPYFWSSMNNNTSFTFSKFLSHVLAFLNSILLLNQMNQVVVIASGYNSCDYVFDSSTSSMQRAECLLEKLEDFVDKDESLSREESVDGVGFSLLSGSLSMALGIASLDLFELLDIQRVFRSGPLHPQPRILCLHGSPDGPGQYVAVMNSIFSAQRSMVPIDSCAIGSQHSAFLQQASYITGGVYLKPQVSDGLFQYLSYESSFQFFFDNRKLFPILPFFPLQLSKSTDHPHVLLAERSSSQIFLFVAVLSSVKTVLTISLLTPAVLSHYKCCELTNYFESAAFDKIRAFVIKTRLTWVTYALFAYQSSASITRNAQLADQILERHESRIPQPQIRGDRLQLGSRWEMRRAGGKESFLDADT
ncbi:hypothetical protein FXO37_17380 [Capsicum annuum]|nr:hypothetical protein FXO37_17380 [Capsicum annuum]